MCLWRFSRWRADSCLVVKLHVCTLFSNAFQVSSCTVMILSKQCMSVTVPFVCLFMSRTTHHSWSDQATFCWASSTAGRHCPSSGCTGQPGWTLGEGGYSCRSTGWGPPISAKHCHVPCVNQGAVDRAWRSTDWRKCQTASCKLSVFCGVCAVIFYMVSAITMYGNVIFDSRV